MNKSLYMYTSMNVNYRIHNRQVYLNNLAVVNSPKVAFCTCMLLCNFLCYVNDTRALIDLCFLVTSHWDEVRDPCDSKWSVSRKSDNQLAIDHYSAYGNWSVATNPLFYSSEIQVAATVAVATATAFNYANTGLLMHVVYIYIYSMAGINEENVEPNRFWNYTNSDSDSDS